MSRHRILRRHAIVAMRSLADTNGLVFEPRHARALRDVQQHHPKFISISPAPEGVAPRPYFAASITPAGAKIIQHSNHSPAGGL